MGSERKKEPNNENKDVNMNWKHVNCCFNLLIALMLFMAFSAIGKPLNIAVMGFKEDDASVEAMSRQLSAMTKE